MKNAFECKRILVENIVNSREKLLIRRKQLKNYDLHWHDCFEIELVLRGGAVQILNGERYEMLPGDIYMLSYCYANPTDFHSTTGKTYKEYINTLKLEHTKKLTLTSTISVTEICYAAGFNSLTNFLRVFKNEYGISPAAMRKRKKRIAAS